MTDRVGPEGQVVIPKKLWDELGIEPGDEVRLTARVTTCSCCPCGGADRCWVGSRVPT